MILVVKTHAGVAQLFRVRNAQTHFARKSSGLKLVSISEVSGSRNVTVLARPRMRFIKKQQNLYN